MTKTVHVGEVFEELHRLREIFVSIRIAVQDPPPIAAVYFDLNNPFSFGKNGFVFFLYRNQHKRVLVWLVGLKPSFRGYIRKRFYDTCTGSITSRFLSFLEGSATMELNT